MKYIYFFFTYFFKIVFLSSLGSRNFARTSYVLCISFMLFVNSINAQINTSFNFENSLQGWTTSGYGVFEISDILACGSGTSARANTFFNGTSTFVSPLLGSSITNNIALSFDYKVINYQNSIGASASNVDIKVQWSNSSNGPWTTFFTINASNHTASSSCITKSTSLSPSIGPLFIRFQNKAIGTTADIYYYYDNITLLEGLPTSCQSPIALQLNPQSLNSDSFEFTWAAPQNVPSLGYEYEVRTAGLAGSGPTGLVATSSVSSANNAVLISNLTAATNYTIYIRSKCGALNYSSWIASLPIRTLCDAIAVPYIVPHSAAVVPALPPCLLVENSNNDDRFWKTIATTSGITGKVLQYNYNFAMAADDWFFLQKLDLLAGVSYRISFKYKALGYEEKLKVAIGAGPNSAAMSRTLLDITIAASTINAVQQDLDFVVTNDGDYSIGFQAHSDANRNQLFVGEISVVLGPSCSPPSSIVLNEIDKTSADISWSAASITPSSGYIYEVRTQGLPGSGSTGLQSFGAVAAETTSVAIQDLDPETFYWVYVASKCIGDDQSLWCQGLQITTLCDYIELQALNDTVCAGTSALLSVLGTDDNVDWYETADSNEIIATNTTFSTPPLLESRSYYAAAASVEEDRLIQIGNGQQLAQSYQNPFYSVWSNNHTQHIIRASELRSKGMVAGFINSVAINVTNPGTIPLNLLQIKIGNTTNSSLNSFVATSSFSTIFTASVYMPVLGTNVFTFFTPYIWDGISNIVLDFCHGNPDVAITMIRSIAADETSYLSTVKANFSSAAQAQAACENSTQNFASYYLRPLFIFNATFGCTAPERTEVIATVTQVDPIAADSIQIIIVETLEDATLEDLEPSTDDILWYASLLDATSSLNPLPINTQVESGIVYYAVRSQNGCQSPPFPVLVTVELGLNENELIGITLFPNPVQDQLQIVWFKDIHRVEVFNLLGKKVLSLSPNSPEILVDMSKLTSGIYFIKILSYNLSKIYQVIRK